MSVLAKQNVNLAMEMLLDIEKDNSEEIHTNEEAINHLNKSITTYLTKLVSKELSSEDDKKVGSYFHVVSDIERIGDYAENIMEYSQRLRKEEMTFSSGAKNELIEIVETFNKLYDSAITAFESRNVEKLAEVDLFEEKIDEITADLENKHIERVKKGACTAQLGSVYLQTVSNLERIADHITNVAFSIRHYRSIDSAKNVKSS
jgi:phosphate:Na+ symporter